MRPSMPMSIAAAAALATRRFSRWDALAVLLALGVLAFIGSTGRHLTEPLARLEVAPVTLDVWALPEYAVRTALRMIAALAFSLVFTLTYATLAAKNKRAEQLLIPILDILQSVPILGFISITVVFFMSLFRAGARRRIRRDVRDLHEPGVEHDVQLLPVAAHGAGGSDEVSRGFRLSTWQRFWRLEVPFAMPGLIWNMMMSMSGGWFFVVASEAITVGNSTIMLPGIGSYIALAIEKRDLSRDRLGDPGDAVVILLYDQLLFRPLVAWADKFRVEHRRASSNAPRSWLLDLCRARSSTCWRWRRAGSALREAVRRADLAAGGKRACACPNCPGIDVAGARWRFRVGARV